MFRLNCVCQNYDWGKVGPESLVFQLENNQGNIVDASKPYAEFWMGAHPSGPSTLPGNNDLSLAEYIQRNSSILGKNSLEKFGECLPFLFKVLSTKKALSIQAHPDKSLAEILHSEQPDMYKDDNHKPELAIALTDFEALLAFRPVAEIMAFRTRIPELNGLILEDVPFELDEDKAIVKFLYSQLMNSSPDKVAIAASSLANRLKINEKSLSVPEIPSNSELARLFIRLNEQYPGDVGCFSIFFLNYVKLHPGEAIFLASGLPHAYISGDCVECMANSDNVVRAGLTPKTKDVPRLLEMLDYTPIPEGELRFIPNKNVIPSVSPASATIVSFFPPVEEFAVDRILICEINYSLTLPLLSSASIIVCLQGKGVIFENSSESIKADFGPGAVYFVPADISVAIETVGASGVLAFRAYANA